MFLTEDEKYNAVINDILNSSKKEQPVLIGTTSIENSEKLSLKLMEKKINRL